MTPATDILASALDALRAAIADVLTEYQALINQVADLKRRLGEATPPPPPTPVPVQNPQAALLRDAVGWTKLPISPDARTIYISASLGNATNDGLAPDRALPTLAAGIRLLRDGFPDRLLLRAGDTFTGPENVFGNWNKSGRSSAEPMLIGVYGDGDRPRIIATEVPLNCYGDGSFHDLAIVGLHFIAARRDPRASDFDPSASVTHGLRVLKPSRNLLIEDCRLAGFGTNLGISKAKQFTIRRCIVTDAWATADIYSGQGLYVESSEDLLIEENCFDHNGWLDAPAGVTPPVGSGPNLFRHNLYLQSDNTGDVIVRGNLIAHGASHGAWMRSGGTCQQNLFVDNALHLQIAGQSSQIDGNLMLGGHDIGAQLPRGFGITLLSRQAICRGNLLAEKASASPFAGCAIGVDTHSFTAPGTRDVRVENNTIRDWAGTGIEIGPCAGAISVSGNRVSLHPTGRALADVRVMPSAMTWAENSYDSLDAATAGWFRLLNKPASWEAWLAATREARSAAQPASRVAGSPPLSAAAVTLLGAARDRSRGAWPVDRTAGRFITSHADSFAV